MVMLTNFGNSWILPCLLGERFEIWPVDQGFPIPPFSARLGLVQVAIRQVDQMPTQHSSQNNESFCETLSQQHLSAYHAIYGRTRSSQKWVDRVKRTTEPSLKRQ